TGTRAGPPSPRRTGRPPSGRGPWRSPSWSSRTRRPADRRDRPRPWLGPSGPRAGRRSPRTGRQSPVRRPPRRRPPRPAGLTPPARCRRRSPPRRARRWRHPSASPVHQQDAHASSPGDAPAHASRRQDGTLAPVGRRGTDDPPGEQNWDLLRQRGVPSRRWRLLLLPLLAIGALAAAAVPSAGQVLIDPAPPPPPEEQAETTLAPTEGTTDPGEEVEDAGVEM